MFLIGCVWWKYCVSFKAQPWLFLESKACWTFVKALHFLCFELEVPLLACLYLSVYLFIHPSIHHLSIIHLSSMASIHHLFINHLSSASWWHKLYLFSYLPFMYVCISLSVCLSCLSNTRLLSQIFRKCGGSWHRHFLKIHFQGCNTWRCQWENLLSSLFLTICFRNLIGSRFLEVADKRR